MEEEDESKPRFTLEGGREGKRLIVQFPGIHKDAVTVIHFERTLRVPDDGKSYPLPPGFGAITMRHLEDFESNLPEDWKYRGGVIMPLHTGEAMWIGFGEGYPCAVKVGAGKINAVSGKRWKEGLRASDRDYVVAPPQRWLDGFCVKKDRIRQFVAMPLGRGYTAEEQLLGGKAQHGGIQLLVYPMKWERYQQLKHAAHTDAVDDLLGDAAGFIAEHSVKFSASYAPIDHGLSPGAELSERVYADEHGVEAWDTSAPAKCFVSILDARQWSAVTRDKPPTAPPTAADYAEAGLPWFEEYKADIEANDGSPELASLKSVQQQTKDEGILEPAEREIDPGTLVVRPIRPPRRKGLGGIFGKLLPPWRRV